MELAFAKKSRWLATRIGACGTLLLVGCGIPNLRQSPLQNDVPPEFTKYNREGTESAAEKGDNSSRLSIDEFYHDDNLSGLIEQALANNLELGILNEDVQMAKNDVLARQGAYLPFIGYGLIGGFDKPSLFTRDGMVDNQLNILPGQGTPNPLWNTGAGLDLFWQLDIWRQLRNARDAAIQRYIAASEKRNFFVTQLVADVAENYYRLMALDKRIENLNRTIQLNEKGLEIAKARKDAGRGTELGVQRFEAEVRKNQSEKWVVQQNIVEVENKINFMLNRFPEPVPRVSDNFYDLVIHDLSIGLPAELLANRPDIRQAERELEATGLDIRVARARFFPVLAIHANVGYAAFNPKYFLNTPEAIVANVAGDLVGPLINKKAIKADYMTANARQLQAVYNYQRTVLNAFTEVVNRMTKVENYNKSIVMRKQQLDALEASILTATRLFQNLRAEYMDVLFAQRDMMDARMDLIETKKEQLAAVVNVYQALGGGNVFADEPLNLHGHRP